MEVANRFQPNLCTGIELDEVIASQSEEALRKVVKFLIHSPLLFNARNGCLITYVPLSNNNNNFMIITIIIIVNNNNKIE